MTSLVYVGTYTGPERAQGISVFRLDPESRALDPLQTVTGLNSPTFLALHPQFPGPPLPLRGGAPGGGAGTGSGAVSSFAVDPRQGTLTLLNRQPSGGLCYVSVHPQEAWSSPRTTPAGTWPPSRCCRTEPWAPPLSVVQHQGSGPCAARQEGPHAHSIGPSPDGRFVLACDLGIDRVMVYRLDPDGQPPGLAGERSPAGVANPLRPPALRLPSPAAVRLRGQRAGLPRSPSTPTTPDGRPGQRADRPRLPRLQRDESHRPDHRALRGASSTPPTGGTTASPSSPWTAPAGASPLPGTPHRGRVPRNFNVHPAGRLLLAGNQDSGTVVPFRIDPQSGAPTGRVTETPAPVCIIFREG